MTRHALSSSPDPQFRNDEATGTRSTAIASAEVPSLSPLAFAGQLLAVGRAQEALDIFEAEIAAGNDTAALHFGAGRAAFRLGNYERAQRALSRAVALAPDGAEAQRWLARVLLRRGNVVGAARVMSRASGWNTSPNAAPHLDALANELWEIDFEASESDEPPTTQWMSSRRRPKADPTQK